MGSFRPEILEYSYPNVYYHGYWLNRKWFAAFRDIFRRELSFKPITKPGAKEYADRILSETSVGVHVRRGDFVALGWNLPTYIYEQAIRMIAEDFRKFTLFVFSDDLEWCREHKKELGFCLAKKVVYVSGNQGKDSYLDMQLMGMCEGLIVSNSSFSCLSALLAKRLKMYIDLAER